MNPFADDSAAASVGDMRLENGRDRIAIYGSLDVTRDKAGLALVQALRAVLDQVVAVLEADPALPATLAPPKRPGTARNPFS